MRVNSSNIRGMKHFVKALDDVADFTAGERRKHQTAESLARKAEKAVPLRTRDAMAVSTLGLLTAYHGAGKQRGRKV